MNLPVMVPGLDRDTILEWARRIDAGPYSSLAAGERIWFPNPEIMVVMSAAAAVTERVAINFSVVVLPMHSAVHIAKQIATLDVISNGRVVLGVGVGGREEDYRAFDAPFDKKRLSRMERQVDIMRRAWAGERVVEEALRPLEPAPVQAGGPPILSGSIFPGSVKRSARWADGISGFSFGPDRDELATCFETARAAWKEQGRDMPPRLVTSCWYAVGDGARARLDEYLRRYLNFMGADVADQLAPLVTTDSAAKLKDVIRMLEDLGADELLLVPTTSDPDEIDRVADIIGQIG
jgi:alkanesulfonate monooxygenase SsuD/methylene tetrahydromethanopterin reductase-like flavin-dependent oxidoreductase (luciferase family)